MVLEEKQGDQNHWLSSSVHREYRRQISCQSTWWLLRYFKHCHLWALWFPVSRWPSGRLALSCFDFFQKLELESLKYSLGYTGTHSKFITFTCPQIKLSTNTIWSTEVCELTTSKSTANSCVTVTNTKGYKFRGEQSVLMIYGRCTMFSIFEGWC